MRAKCLILFLVIFQVIVRVPESEPRDSLLFLFWNLENFFDWRDDEASESPSDTEYSSFGKQHWTRRKFQIKCQAVAKTILWAGDQAGKLPDVIGVAEVENRFVLEQLVKTSALRKLDYRIVHFESPDPRGIDVALLYRASQFKVLDAKPLRVVNPDPAGEPLQTRDILSASLLVLPEERDSLTVLVNHHPSKYGGGSTDWRREAALKRLRSIVDSLQTSGQVRIVAMGDFNDTPDHAAFDLLKPDPDHPNQGLRNLAESLFREGIGSLRYNGRWELIDMFFLSPGWAEDARMRILHPPFLTVRDNAHSGEKPLRTYSGPRYQGGVSDHCPIVLELKFP